MTVFLQIQIILKKLAKIDTDEFYNKAQMSTKFQSNLYTFNGDMITSNFDDMCDNL